MWVMTTHGMVSIVADPKHPGQLQVRAREKRALEWFLPGWKVVKTPKADYRFRCAGVQRLQVGRALAMLVNEIDYPNFKDAAAKIATPSSADYVTRLHRAWSVMGGDTMSYGGR